MQLQIAQIIRAVTLQSLKQRVTEVIKELSELQPLFLSERRKAQKTKLIHSRSPVLTLLCLSLLLKAPTVTGKVHVFNLFYSFR